MSKTYLGKEQHAALEERVRRFCSDIVLDPAFASVPGKDLVDEILAAVARYAGRAYGEPS